MKNKNKNKNKNNINDYIITDTNVLVPIVEFKNLLKKLKNCQKDKEKLIDTVNYLNKEIENYNKIQS